MKQIVRFFQISGLSSSKIDTLQSRIQRNISEVDIKLTTELCYNIGTTESLNTKEEEQLIWLLAHVNEKDKLKKCSWIAEEYIEENCILVEYGPRLSFATAFSTNAVSICHGVGLNQIYRIELSRRYLFKLKNPYDRLSFQSLFYKISDLLHDRMTEVLYEKNFSSFHMDISREHVYEIDITSSGRDALEKANTEMGLALDEWDLNYYTNMFQDKLKRNPTNVECFDLAQSNSEHSRHWFFKGNLVIDGEKMESCLMDVVGKTQRFSNNNNVIKFCDNSSAIQGFEIKTLIPENSTEASAYGVKDTTQHILFTAETHNFPTGVAPFPGATTGTGGRIRDGHATGKGSNVIAGTAGYCFGNLKIPGYELQWEDKFQYPSNFASPLEIAIEASNGASDYGNKFGEPVICGFTRSFGMLMANGERREWIKPIMFSGGVGSICDEHIRKDIAKPGMKVVKVGGPVYRIGVGGGAASSIQVQGDNCDELDFGAVQRGDPEMEQKLNRVIRACVEMREKNPICSIHDQGAGGNGNVLKEICEPAGAVIRTGDFQLGDETLSALEIWGAEYQESDALLIESTSCEMLKKIGEREKVDISFVGDITGNGDIVLKETRDCVWDVDLEKKTDVSHVVNLPLDIVLGKMPPKTYYLERMSTHLVSIDVPLELSVKDALEQVLRLPSVASKRYLTNKVDRSVTGLVAQQQCVGPLHTPLADCAVIALSHFETVGGVIAIGEQPIKMLIDPQKGARLTVAEAFTNIMFSMISDLKDVKCSANWMWPAKLPGEGARLYDACCAMSDMLSGLGAAVDGGKDSLSMAARVEDEIVKAPGSLVVSLYAPCPDIRKSVTPDLKLFGNTILYIDMCGMNEFKLGGSALAQVYKQIGDDVPDIPDLQMFSNCFNAIQYLVSNEMIESGHDVSDGGLITTILEMCFAGNFAVTLNFNEVLSSIKQNHIEFLFAEKPGAVLEISGDNLKAVTEFLSTTNVPFFVLGAVTNTNVITIKNGGTEILSCEMKHLRHIWESTSFQLERLQCHQECVDSEQASLDFRHNPNHNFNFVIDFPEPLHKCLRELNVAVLREEGSNGDREMTSCLYLAGFNVYDVTMQDICQGRITLNSFRGLVFVGGFSYADVFGSAKGWASIVKFNETAFAEFETFRRRPDTFSLGVCNGCQLMALLGWVGQLECSPESNICFTHNTSGRFESRFVNVRIEKSPSIMFQGMQDSVLGVWVAHGEGKVSGTSNHIQQLVTNNLVPIRYVDDDGETTNAYPLNPNGSPDGIAGFCSTDGRHLAMMPHPERSFLMWQLPWKPIGWKGKEVSPWFQMFRNAYKWSTN